MRLIAPSILAANFLQLGKDVAMIQSAGADWVHFDVMDGRFVPNISFGLPVLKAVSGMATIPLDVHLMIVEPEKYLEDFRQAGAQRLTVHAEAVIHLDRVLNEIRRMGMAPGVALNPSTPWESVKPVLHLMDTLLFMTVNPGFGGQKFIPYTLDKIREARQWLDGRGLKPHIQVDGGVDIHTIGALADAGADCFVSGSAIFGAPDPAAYLQSLRG
jgi:ribulose-phosphate 3-epimerase